MKHPPAPTAGALLRDLRISCDTAYPSFPNHREVDMAHLLGNKGR